MDTKITNMKRAILILLIFCSCGIKKKNVERINKSAKEYVTRSYEVNSNVKITSDARTSKLRITPIDKDKPATYTDPSGNKHALDNAELTTETEEVKKQEEKQEEATGQEEKGKEEQEKGRKTESKSFRMNTFLMIFVGLGILLAVYLLITKKKT